MAKQLWKIDPAHSEIMFKVKHLMLTTVTGYFRKFDATVETEGDNFDKVSSIRFSAETASIDTNNDQRDTHLRSADFFKSEEFPQLTFSASDVSLKGEESEITGDLTIRGTTLPVTLKVEFGGILTDPYGQTKAGFTLSGKIKRKEFGLTWDAVTEAGNVVVSDEVRLLVEVQLVKQTA